MSSISITSPTGATGPAFIAQGLKDDSVGHLLSFVISPDLREVILGRTIRRPSRQWAAFFYNVPDGPWLLAACDLLDPLPTLTTRLIGIVGASSAGCSIEYPVSECVPMQQILAWGYSDAPKISTVQAQDSSSPPNTYSGTIKQHPSDPQAFDVWTAEIDVQGECANGLQLNVVDSQGSTVNSDFSLETCEGGCSSPP